MQENWQDVLSFTGINTKQSQWLVEKDHIYLTVNGRISMAGLNSHNIEYFARALDNVVRQWRHDMPIKMSGDSSLEEPPL